MAWAALWLLLQLLDRFHIVAYIMFGVGLAFLLLGVTLLLLLVMSAFDARLMFGMHLLDEIIREWLGRWMR